MPTPVRRLVTALAIVALPLGPAFDWPSVATARQDDGMPAFERVATQTLTLPDAVTGAEPGDSAETALAWQVTSLSTLPDGADPVPFAPGFLYSPDAMLLIYRDTGRFSRLPAGDALGLDGSRAVAPVSYDGEGTAFLAIELLPAEGEPDDATTFAVPDGEWELTLWRLELPDGAAELITLDAGDAGMPVLVVVTDGEATPASGAGEDDGPLAADDDARTLDGPIAVTADGAATAVAVTIAPPGTTDTAPSRSPRASGAGGGTGDGTGGGTGDGTDSGGSTAPPPPSVPPALDIDGDGLADAVETGLGTTVTNPDTDGDSLTDGEEVLTYGTNPLLVDTDGDGYDDNREIFNYMSDPLVRDTDTDGDRILDAVELRLGTDINSLDSDGDCLRDDTELNTGVLDPTLADTDGDGASDLAQYSGIPDKPCVPGELYAGGTGSVSRVWRQRAAPTGVPSGITGGAFDRAGFSVGIPVGTIAGPTVGAGATVVPTVAVGAGGVATA